MRVSLNEENQFEWIRKGMESLRYEYDLLAGETVIDVGAYRGEWAAQMFEKYHCNLVLVEPTTSVLGFPSGEVINKAAATYDGTMAFGGLYYYTSAFEDQHTQYPCFDVNKLLEKYDEIALIKINIEGYEYELLNHVIDAGLIARVRNLQVQFHLVEDVNMQEQYDTIADKLAWTHKISWRCPFVWESWERI